MIRTGRTQGTVGSLHRFRSWVPCFSSRSRRTFLQKSRSYSIEVIRSAGRELIGMAVNFFLILSMPILCFLDFAPSVLSKLLNQWLHLLTIVFQVQYLPFVICLNFSLFLAYKVSTILLPISLFLSQTFFTAIWIYSLPYVPFDARPKVKIFQTTFFRFNLHFLLIKGLPPGPKVHVKWEGLNGCSSVLYISEASWSIFYRF